MKIAIAFLIAGMSTVAADVGSAPSARIQKFLGAAAITVLQHPEKVEAYRLKPQRAQEGEADVGGYLIDGTGTTYDAKKAQRLSGLLLDGKTYRFDFADDRCEFRPVIGYRIWKGDQHVEVLISFKCEDLVVFSPAAKDGSIRSAMADFQPAKRAMDELARECVGEIPGE